MTLSDELARLEELRRTGSRTEEEFAAAKKRLLDSPPPTVQGQPYAGDLEKDTRLWAMLLHLSTLLGHAPAPLLGLIVPIVIWQIKKTDLPEIDQHGKNAVNWIISELIYLVITGLLSLLLIGLPLLFAVAILGIVFPIVAAIKASNGEVWKYPLSIRFFR